MNTRYTPDQYRRLNNAQRELARAEAGVEALEAILRSARADTAARLAGDTPLAPPGRKLFRDAD